MLARIASGIALALEAVEAWKRVAKSLGHSEEDLATAIAAARRERAVQVQQDREAELRAFGERHSEDG